MTNFDQNMRQKFFSPKIEAGDVLKMFLFFGEFQPGCSYKGVLIKKKRCTCSRSRLVPFVLTCLETVGKGLSSGSRRRPSMFTSGSGGGVPIGGSTGVEAAPSLDCCWRCGAAASSSEEEAAAGARLGTSSRLRLSSWMKGVWNEHGRNE